MRNAMRFVAAGLLGLTAFLFATWLAISEPKARGIIVYSAAFGFFVGLFPAVIFHKWTRRVFSTGNSVGAEYVSGGLSGILLVPMFFLLIKLQQYSNFMDWTLLLADSFDDGKSSAGFFGLNLAIFFLLSFLLCVLLSEGLIKCFMVWKKRRPTPTSTPHDRNGLY